MAAVPTALLLEVTGDAQGEALMLDNVSEQVEKDYALGGDQ